MKDEVDGGFLTGGVAVGALGKEVGIGEVAPVGAGGTMTIEGKTDGVEEGGFAASVESSHEDDGLVGAARSEVNALPSPVKTKVLQDELLEDHEGMLKR